ncbi:hypothetical protein [Streptomyces sp. NPDC127036]|uniref:hypothetical protein n=1 Tax=Streptomyces sp. NPDC127036 TaxID=3347112 RepID=UPI00364992A1
MRVLLAEDAYTIRPSPAPYTAIRKRGRRERKQRAAAVAALISLCTLPAVAYTLAGGDRERGTHTAAPKPSDGPPRTSAAATPGPTHSAAEGQLLDGITFTQAFDGLEKCLAAERGAPSAPLGKAEAEAYRIILAAKSTGSSAPEDSFHVVGVREQPAGMRVVCDIEDGEASGITTGTSDDDPPDVGPVVPDLNSRDLFQQMGIDKGRWKLPFRWAVVGTVDPAVAEVSVSYGSATRQAALDHGWFVASGMLRHQATAAPHIRGYDSAGKLLYDSDQDKHWTQTLP